MVKFLAERERESKITHTAAQIVAVVAAVVCCSEREWKLFSHTRSHVKAKRERERVDGDKGEHSCWLQ